jgi:small subunit ribosomal protein S8
MLARIRNGQRAGHRSVLVTASKFNKSVLEVLKREGLIEGFEAAEDLNKHPAIRVGLRYYTSGKPLISRAERVSKPGCRKYFEMESLPKVSSGLGIAIVSTSKGVMTDHEARKNRVGGEVIALVG